MLIFANLVSLALTVYALGLVAYIVLSWAHHPAVDKPRRWLERLYLPFLTPLRRILKPVRLSATAIDFTPCVLLLGIWVLRELVLSLLVTAVR